MWSRVLVIAIGLIFQPCVFCDNDDILRARECGSFAGVSPGSNPLLSWEDPYSPLDSKGGAAALHKSSTNLGSSTQKCGAVLISDSFLLTTAHCVINANDRFSISLGREDLDENPHPGNNTYDIQKVTIHPGYGTTTADYDDIAILKTARKVQYSKNIWPFCLPASNETFRSYLPVEIAGWGYVNETHKGTFHTAFVNLLDSTHCLNEWYKNAPEDFLEIINSTYPNLLTNQVLCARREGVDACANDNGGPMSYTNQFGQQTLIGLIGKRTGCPHYPVTPGFYTNVANYIDWIYEIIGLSETTSAGVGTDGGSTEDDVIFPDDNGERKTNQYNTKISVVLQ